MEFPVGAARPKAWGVCVGGGGGPGPPGPCMLCDAKSARFVVHNLPEECFLERPLIDYDCLCFVVLLARPYGIVAEQTGLLSLHMLSCCVLALI